MVTHRRSAIEGDVRLTMVSGVQHWRPALTSGVGVRSYRPAAAAVLMWSDFRLLLEHLDHRSA